MYIQEKKINIAVSAFIMKNEKFILLKRANCPIRWCPPGGRVRKGENLIEATIRESREEAGVDIRVLMPITYWFLVNILGRFCPPLVFYVNIFLEN